VLGKFVPGCGNDGVLLGVVGLLPVLEAPVFPLLPLRCAKAEIDKAKIKTALRRMELDIWCSSGIIPACATPVVEPMLRPSARLSSLKRATAGRSGRETSGQSEMLNDPLGDRFRVDVHRGPGFDVIRQLHSSQRP